MREGDIVNARVVEDLGENRYALRTEKARIVVVSSRPLRARQEVTGHLTARNGRLQIGRAHV